MKPKHDPGSKEQIEMVEGMSGTLSFQPDPKTLFFSENVKNLKSYRGREPLYPEQFVENIKHEYMCPICKEVLEQPVQTRCPTPHIFCCQLPFICLWDLWIPLPSLQNCNWKSSGVLWTSSFCSTNYTIRTRFSVPYMHTYYKTTSAATASRKLQIKPCDNTHTKWNPSARSSFSYTTTFPPPPPHSSDTPTSTCSSTCSSWTCSCTSTTYRTWSCCYLCRATDSTTTTTYPTGSIIIHLLKRS